MQPADRALIRTAENNKQRLDDQMYELQDGVKLLKREGGNADKREVYEETIQRINHVTDLLHALLKGVHEPGAMTANRRYVLRCYVKYTTKLSDQVQSLPDRSDRWFRYWTLDAWKVFVSTVWESVHSNAAKVYTGLAALSSACAAFVAACFGTELLTACGFAIAAECSANGAACGAALLAGGGVAIAVALVGLLGIGVVSGAKAVYAKYHPTDLQECRAKLQALTEQLAAADWVLLAQVLNSSCEAIDKDEELAKDCVVCHEFLAPGQERVRYSPQHPKCVFHKDCLTEWLRHRQICPQCNTP